MKIRLQFSLFTIACLLLSSATMAQVKWFEDSPEPAVARQDSRKIVPEKYRTLSYDFDSFFRDMSAAPSEDAVNQRDNNFTVDIPLPDGTSFVAKMVYSPSYDKAFENNYPEFRTFAFQGAEDASIAGRFGFTAMGVHGIFSKDGELFYISSYATETKNHCIVYNTKALAGIDNLDFECGVGNMPVDLNEMKERVSPVRRPGFTPKNGQNRAQAAVVKRRELKLAIGATGEYSDFWDPAGNAPSLALSGVIVTVNSVNFIFGRDAGIRFNLIGNTAAIIYPDPDTDPYTNASNTSVTAGQNNTNTIGVIGAGNFDIGQAFSAAGGGGIATVFVSSTQSFGNICSTSRGQASSHSTTPTGYPFDFFVAHELGHQIGAGHSFTLNLGICAGGVNPRGSAVEPGHGSTIMSYGHAPCGASERFITGNVPQYFNGKSIQEMQELIVGSKSGCGTDVITTNTVPELVSSDFGGLKIPKGTPFYTEAKFSDADGGGLTYTWEQMDEGSAISSVAQLSDPVGDQPVHRSFPPSSTRRRDYPKREYLIAEEYHYEDQLVDYERDLTLRCTVRDNNASGGGIARIEKKYQVVDNVGPFEITNLTSGDFAGGLDPGEYIQLHWSVNGTDGAPFNTTDVRVKMSVDNGMTFPITVVESAPNNGFVNFPLPNVAGTQCRFMLEPTNDFNYYAIGTAPNQRIAMNTPTVTDLELTKVTLPQGAGCEDDIVPSFTFKNVGTTVISQVYFRALLDGVQLQTLSAPGISLQPGESAVYNYSLGGTAQISTSTPGAHNLEFYAYLPGITENNTANNTKFDNFVRGTHPINIDVTTDRYGAETTWNIADSNGTVVLSGGGYETVADAGAYPQPTTIHCLDVGCYTFNVFDSASDGMWSTAYGNGFITLTNQFDNQLGSTPMSPWGASTSFSFCISDGCTEPGACNYDPLASFSDGSCTFDDCGCTDATAYNWDPAAINDNGSCIFDCAENQVIFQIDTDCFPDELTWTVNDANGMTVYAVSDNNTPQGQKTLLPQFCLPDGCYSITVNDSFGDGFTQVAGVCGSGSVLPTGFKVMLTSGEVLYEISAPVFSSSFTTDLFCVGDGGCTNQLASNYDMSAPFDDGSCVYNCLNANVRVDLFSDCNPEDVSWQLFDDAGSELGSFDGYEGEGQFYGTALCLEPGCYRIELFDAGGDGLNGAASGCAQNGNFGVFNGDRTLAWFNSYVNFPGGNYGAQTTIEFCVGISGCTNPLANNYDPEADEDNGLCAFDCNDEGEAIFNLRADDVSPWEVSWALKDDQGNTLQSVPFLSLTAYVDYSYELCLAPGCYQIEINDSAGNGMINAGSQNGQGAASLVINGETVELLDPNFVYSTLVWDFCIEAGCTNELASNYATTANLDDGSCEYQCFGEGTNFTTALQFEADCYPEETSWSLVDADGNVLIADIPLENEDGSLNDAHFFCLEEGCYEFVIADFAGDGLNGSIFSNCTEDGNLTVAGSDLVPFYNAQAAGEIDFAAGNGFELRIPFCVASGCTNALASNYDPTVGIDNGSCEYNCPGDAVSPQFAPDCYPEEITWSLLDDAGNVLIDTYPLVQADGSVFDTAFFCLEDGCYEFVINDSFGDGLAGFSSGGGCESDGVFTLFDPAGNTIYSTLTEGTSNFGSELRIPFCIGNTCTADINMDGTVSIPDLLALVSNLGCIGSCVGDLDSNGTTNIGDLLSLISVLGTDCD